MLFEIAICTGIRHCWKLSPLRKPEAHLLDANGLFLREYLQASPIRCRHVWTIWQRHITRIAEPRWLADDLATILYFPGPSWSATTVRLCVYNLLAREAVHLTLHQCGQTPLRRLLLLVDSDATLGTHRCRIEILGLVRLRIADPLRDI